MSTLQPNTTQWEQALSFIALHRDKQAYSQLFSYFSLRLKTFGLNIFGNEQLAMDMVQDICSTSGKKHGCLMQGVAVHPPGFLPSPVTCVLTCCGKTKSQK